MDILPCFKQDFLHYPSVQLQHPLHSFLIHIALPQHHQLLQPKQFLSVLPMFFLSSFPYCTARNPIVQDFTCDTV